MEKTKGRCELLLCMQMYFARETSGSKARLGGGGGVYCHMLLYVGYIGMCHCEGYGFQAVYSGIGYINQRV